MWPADRPDLKLRVVWATFILVFAKLDARRGALFLQVGDGCAGARCADAALLPAFLLAPTMLVLAYNVIARRAGGV